jgi:hypothetical protein
MSRHRVRSLTLAHLDRLVAIGVLANACGRDVGYGVVDPIPSPVSGEPSEDDGSHGTIPEAGQGATTTTPTTTPEPVRPPDQGYAVVDPAPPPPEPCETFAAAVRATARVREGHVELTISSGRYQDVVLAPSAQATVTGATISASEDALGRLRLTLDMSEPTAVVTVAGSCAGQRDHVELRVTPRSLENGAPVSAVIVPPKQAR